MLWCYFFMYVADFLILYVLSTIGSCKLHLLVCNTTISQLKIDMWEFDFFLLLIRSGLAENLL